MRRAEGERSRAPLLGGALLFLLSDLLLGDSAFRHARGPLWNDLEWLAYILGQTLIVTSVPRVARM